MQRKSILLALTTVAIAPATFYAARAVELTSRFEYHFHPGPHYIRSRVTNVTQGPDGTTWLLSEVDQLEKGERIPSIFGYRLTNLMPDMKPDRTWGDEGSVYDQAIVHFVVSDPKGRVLIGGGTVPPVGARTNSLLLRRYLPDGALDPSFGQEGTSTTDIGGLSGAISARFLPDGGLQVTAERNELDATNLVVDFKLVTLRFSETGELDPEFGRHGKVVVELPVEYGPIRPGLPQPDGKTVFVGDLRHPSRSGEHWNASTGNFLLRLDENGERDAAFGKNGEVRSVPPSDTSWRAVALDSDGSIAVTGFYRTDSGENDGEISRYADDGRLISRTAFLNGCVPNDARADNGILRAIGQSPDGGLCTVTFDGSLFPRHQQFPNPAGEKVYVPVVGAFSANGQFFAIGDAIPSQPEGSQRSDSFIARVE